MALTKITSKVIADDAVIAAKVAWDAANAPA